jgi:hypothetical protein
MTDALLLAVWPRSIWRVPGFSQSELVKREINGMVSPLSDGNPSSTLISDESSVPFRTRIVSDG